LTQFVGDYEEQHHRIEARRMTPLDALKYLMGENGMKPIDLGRLLGNRSVASQILNGKRGLSKTHIAVLSERFRVDAGLFFEKKPMKKTG
jgi:HTH-type transcriptional regulator/antitoxin HigA